MGTDKAQMEYGGIPQALRAAEVLATVCNRVVISRFGSRGDGLSEWTKSYDVVWDEGAVREGPLGGLLAVHRQFPDSYLLVVGCDQPFLTRHTLDFILSGCRRAESLKGTSSDKPNGAMLVDKAGFEHPLPSLWSPDACEKLVGGPIADIGGLKHGLRQTAAHRIEVPSAMITAELISVDDPTSYAQALKHF